MVYFQVMLPGIKWAFAANLKTFHCFHWLSIVPITKSVSQLISPYSQAHFFPTSTLHERITFLLLRKKNGWTEVWYKRRELRSIIEYSLCFCPITLGEIYLRHRNVISACWRQEIWVVVQLVTILASLRLKACLWNKVSVLKLGQPRKTSMVGYPMCG